MKTCSICGINGCVPDVFYAKGSVCKECKRAKQQAYIRCLKESGAYESYLHKHQLKRNEQKELHRRERGCKTREQITAESVQKRRADEIQKLERMQFKQTFCGPPKPSKALISEAAYKRRLYRDNYYVREYQINKRKRYVSEVSEAYARFRLGIRNPDEVLIEVKRLNLLIKRELRNEKRNRAA